ncbi:hypothetical protein Hte_012531 [Hypoxylon texense]
MPSPPPFLARLLAWTGARLDDPEPILCEADRGPTGTLSPLTTPSADAVAGGPGNRILVTKEFSVTSEPVSAEDATAGPVVPTVTATATGPVTSPRKFGDGAGTTIAKTPTTATTATATKMDNGKQQQQSKKEYKFEDDVDEEDELQDVQIASY